MSWVWSSCRSALQARLNPGYISHGSWFRPEGRGTFSCLPKRKYPKRRAPGGLSGPESPIRPRIPCASRQFGRSPNSQNLLRLQLANPARHGGSLVPKLSAMLGHARRGPKTHRYFCRCASQARLRAPTDFQDFIPSPSGGGPGRGDIKAICHAHTTAPTVQERLAGAIPPCVLQALCGKIQLKHTAPTPKEPP